MSQPRRRRRRRRRGGGRAPDAARVESAASSPGSEPDATPKRARRRRRGRGAGSAESASPKSSEDIFRGRARRRPETVGAPPDDRTLEGVIGDLQSIWGVPQNPQEYRITLKVAEDREARGERSASLEVTEEDPAPLEDGQPRREKAPAAPRIGAVGSEAPEPAAAPARRKRSRRRRRRGGGSSGS
jgi:hypothetical protein